MAGSVKLTEGCIAAIMRGETVEKPTVQILSTKKINSANAQERYRIIVSDGKFFNSYAMLATQLNEKITSGELSDFTIVTLDQYIPSALPNNKPNGGGAPRKVLVILAISVIMKGIDVGVKIGDPILYNEISESANSTVPMETSSSTSSSSMLNGRTPVTNRPGNFMPTSDAPGPILPICGINPYQNRWMMKARIVNKSNIRTWSNARGDGKLFSMDLVDESGSIRATAFTDVCDKYYEMFELNKVYYISRCTVKPANKKFTQIPHDFELTLTNDTQVIPCNDNDSSIPQLQFNFTPLSALKDLAADSFVDVIGICKTVGDVQNLVARASKRELKKRDITLVDQTDAGIVLTLWGTQAEEFDGSSMPVIAVKSARVSEFNGGKNLGLVSSSTMQINPDIPQAHQMRGWFDSLGDSHQFSNISNRLGGDGGGGKVYLAKEVVTHQLGTKDKADFLNLEAAVMFIPKERAIYQACVNKDCKKKVTDQNNGTFRCEKCNQEFPNFIYRLMLNAQVCDWTGMHWISLFQEQAETLLEGTAEEIGRSRDADYPQGNYDAYFRKPLFKIYQFRVRAKMETFNNENRMRMSAVGLKPVDFKEASRRLLNEIKTLSGVSVSNN